ncbi:metal ABC transporter permease [Desulfosporosinus shakirovi]|uniref:metal ABC transporter permease n=1 Tax=Desulfosporosinus shakirovi TaxID=2885154 RepID=UPI002897B680|nr:metal ABC transporter permease [Desulfosporosinus sp. SRJS8]MCB8817085.1 metal ABC transporter permease [Desulfosporosinus sp. SRJS8]
MITILGNVFCLTGLWISYEMNIASGASIVILSVGGYFLAYIFRWLVRSTFRRHRAQVF